MDHKCAYKFSLKHFYVNKYNIATVQNFGFLRSKVNAIGRIL
jgi:hypothetical protein